MQRSIRWFVLGMAMLIALVSTWAFLVNLLGPLALPTLRLDGASDDPASPNWEFARSYKQWDSSEAASTINSPPPPEPLPPWWYITARAPNPY